MRQSVSFNELRITEGRIKGQNFYSQWLKICSTPHTFTSSVKRQLKRKIGIALSTIGLIIIAPLLAMLLWLVIHELYQSGNLSFFWRKDLLYFLPVFLFLFPGIYFVHIGRKMLHGEKVGIMQAIEITIMLAIGITLIYFDLAADSDYAVRRVISPSAQSDLPSGYTVQILKKQRKSLKNTADERSMENALH